MSERKEAIYERFCKKLLLAKDARRRDLELTGAKAQLPVEVIAHILGYLPVADIARCRLICRMFREIVQTTAVLQYKMQCFLYGVRDLNHSVSTRVKLAGLLDWRSGWRSGCSETPTGVIQAKPGHQFKKYTLGNIIVQSSIPPENRIFSFTQLASKTLGTTEQHWDIGPLPFPCYQFTVVESQGLMIASEILFNHSARFHLLSVRTGKPHPDASMNPITLNASLPHALSSEDMETLFKICYSGSMVTFIPQAPGFLPGKAWVWDWRAGKQLLTTCGLDLRGCDILDDRHIIVPVHSPGGRCWSLAVVDCYAEATAAYFFSVQDLVDAAAVVLELPALMSDLPPTITVDTPEYLDRRYFSSQYLQRHFYPSPEGRVIVVNIIIDSELEMVWEGHALVVPVSTIMSRIIPANLSLGLVARAPWHTWGAEARYLDSDCIANHVLNLGHSDVFLVYDIPGEERVWIYAFDSLASMTKEISAAQPQALDDLVVEPAALTGYIYSAVQTLLPYRVIKTKITLPDDGTRWFVNIGDHCITLRSPTEVRYYSW